MHRSFASFVVVDNRPVFTALAMVERFTPAARAAAVKLSNAIGVQSCSCAYGKHRQYIGGMRGVAWSDAAAWCMAEPLDLRKGRYRMAKTGTGSGRAAPST